MPVDHFCRGNLVDLLAKINRVSQAHLSKFNLIINLQVAEQIGLTIPESVLSITDILIE